MLIFFVILILTIPLFFLHNLFFVFAYFIILLILALIRKKKIRILPSIFMILSITYFSLLQPFGKILFSIGSFNVTQGALFLGLKKSLVLCSFVYLSQFATSFYVEFNGKFGKIFSSVFFWFNQFSAIKLKKGNAFKQIDDILCNLYFEDESKSDSKIDFNNNF